MTIFRILALAGLVLAVPVSAPAAEKAAAPGSPPAEAAEDEEPESGPVLSPAAMRVADWIAASGDNRELPYAIVDKKAARIFLFDGDGEFVADAPVLIGIAEGDEATPGVGSKNLAEIGPAERTTPAGRFLAKYGLAVGRQRVLWIDYATSVALHPIPAGASRKERRRERMLSETIEDNRITFGCINVPKLLYYKSLRPRFQKKGGYVYVLPDVKPIEEVFPRLRVHALGAGSTIAR